MASTSDIQTVRRNVDEATENNFSDVVLGALIDSDGVAGASAVVWTQKAATYSDLVDVSEAGASHKFSDLHKNALTLAKFWQDKADSLTVTSSGRTRVRKIVRS